MPDAPSATLLRATVLAPVIVVVVAVVAGMNAIDASPVGVFYDDALYAILGKALASGEGYRYLNIPGAPPATHYPPAYPWLLALLWKISPHFPENIALFKTVNAFLLGVVALFTYRFALRRLQMSPLVAGAAAIAATATIPPLVLSSAVLSETLFLALLLAVLPYLESATSQRGVRTAFIVGAIAGALCLVRSHAIALIGAVAVSYALRRLYKEGAIALGAGLLVLLPWLIWVQTHDPLVPAPIRGQYGSYTAWFLDGLRASGLGLLAPTIRDNVSTTYAILARSFSVARNAALDLLAVLAVLTLVVAGAFTFGKRARLTLLFVGLYFAIVLAWPFSPLRFVWGVWPLLVLLMFAGARELFFARAIRVARPIAATAIVIVLVGAIVFNTLGYTNAWWATVARSYTPRIRAQLDWVSNHTTPTDVVAGADEGAVYLYTGRRALPTTVFRAAEYFRAPAEDQSARDLDTMVQAFRPNFVLAWTVPMQAAAARLAAMRPPVLVYSDSMSGGRVYRPR